MWKALNGYWEAAAAAAVAAKKGVNFWLLFFALFNLTHFLSLCVCVCMC